MTGQDADLANVSALMEGEQAMTVFKNTGLLGDQVAKMVDQIGKGETVDTNNDTYDNGERIVPAFLFDPQVVTKDAAVEILVDQAGYCTADQVNDG